MKTIPYRVCHPALRRLALLAVCLYVGPCASAQRTPLDDLLARTSQQVASFLEQFSEVKCSELVSQVKLGKNGKAEYRQESAFDYLVILTTAGGELNFSESRLAEREKKQDNRIPLLVTNGFATLFLVFHPYYQGSFQFAALEDDVIDGKHFSRVHFEHIRGTRSPTALVLRGREYPLDLSGTAWIDPASGVIARIVAGLDTGMEDVGLRSLHSEVQYAPVSFRGVEQTYWFPSLATIEVETPRQHWRNIHRFTDYKRFSVSTEEAVSSKP